MAPRGEMDLAGSPPQAWRGLLRNDLTPAARIVCPPLGETMDLLARSTGLCVSMTGSGSAMFILCDSVAEAQAIARRLPPDMPGRTEIVLPNPW